MLGRWKSAVVAVGLFAAAVPGAARAKDLVAVLEAEIVTLDPHFTTAYISRTFGYMVYDTLFAPNSKGEIKPQMVDSWTVSDDKLTWRFKLRDGLKFHDGAPVTAKDVVASLKRWGERNALGVRLMAVTASLDAADDKTFVLTLKEPYGLVLDSLGATVGPVPFIIPARLAATPSSQQITEIVGSGPFVYDKARHNPGDRMYLRRNADYVSRGEPNDFLSGAKPVKTDGIDIRVVPDGATAAAALQAGEVDYLQYAPFDLIPSFEKDKNLKVMSFSGPHMFTGHYRLNHAFPPFNDPEIRRIALALVDQQEVLDGLGLDKRFAQTCDEFFICGSPYSTPNPAASKDHSIETAKKALKASNYKGEPVVVMIANDLEVPRVSSIIFADRLKRAGFNVDAQATDWATLLQRRLNKTGWSAFGVHALGLDLQTPLTNTAINLNCKDTGGAGFMCAKDMVPLFDEFSHAPDKAGQRSVADKIQAVVYREALAIPFGQLAQPAAYRVNVENLVPSALPVFWTVEKK